MSSATSIAVGHRHWINFEEAQSLSSIQCRSLLIVGAIDEDKITGLSFGKKSLSVARARKTKITFIAGIKTPEGL